CARALLRKGFRKVVLTLGARGALLADASGTVHVPPYAVTAVDTTGAGDAFIGSLAVFLAEGVAETEAVARANLYAGLSTTRVGTQKSLLRRARKNWRFELFYWDYALGVLLLTLALGITLGSSGTEGRSFAADLAQASAAGVGSALLGGGIFNLANILLVAAIEVAGMAVAF